MLYFPNQIVTKPTHKDANILDLVLVNNLDILFGYEVQPVLQIASHHHHSAVFVTTKYKVSENKTLERVPKRSCFDNLNFQSSDIPCDDIYEVLSLFDWCQEFRRKTPVNIQHLV